MSRDVTFPRAGLLALVLFFVPLALADIGIGDSRAKVLQSLGEPAAHAEAGDREILLYPHGGKVELRDGRVTDVRGPLPHPTSAAVTYAPPAPARSGPAPAAKPPSAPASVPPSSSLKPAAVAGPAGRAPASSATGSGQSLASLTEQMEAQSGTVGTMQALNRQMAQITKQLGPGMNMALPLPQTHRPPEFGARFAVALLLHFVITLLALRLAFRIEEMDALWSGILAIGAIDLVVYGALEVLGPATSGLSSMVGIESGIGALVMVVTIQKFCFTKKLQYAVVTAMSVKTVVQLCDMFLFPLVLRALFR